MHQALTANPYASPPMPGGADAVDYPRRFGVTLDDNAILHGMQAPELPAADKLANPGTRHAAAAAMSGFAAMITALWALGWIPAGLGALLLTGWVLCAMTLAVEAGVQIRWHRASCNRVTDTAAYRYRLERTAGAGLAELSRRVAAVEDPGPRLSAAWESLEGVLGAADGEHVALEVVQDAVTKIESALTDTPATTKESA